MRRLLLPIFALLPLAGTVSITHAAESDEAASGQQLFTQRCGACHLENGFGTRVLARRVAEGQAELEKREALPAAYTMAVVRRGIGSMPQIREAELSDEDLRAIADYLENSR